MTETWLIYYGWVLWRYTPDEIHANGYSTEWVMAQGHKYVPRDGSWQGMA